MAAESDLQQRNEVMAYAEEEILHCKVKQNGTQRRCLDFPFVTKNSVVFQELYESRLKVLLEEKNQADLQAEAASHEKANANCKIQKYGEEVKKLQAKLKVGFDTECDLPQFTISKADQILMLKR